MHKLNHRLKRAPGISTLIQTTHWWNLYTPRNLSGAGGTAARHWEVRGVAQPQRVPLRKASRFEWWLGEIGNEDAQYIYRDTYDTYNIYIYIQTGLLEIVLRHAACLFFYVFCVLSPCYFSDMLRDNSALLPRVCDILYMEHGGSSIQTFPIFPRVRRASWWCASQFQRVLGGWARCLHACRLAHTCVSQVIFSCGGVGKMIQMLAFMSLCRWARCFHSWAEALTVRSWRVRKRWLSQAHPVHTSMIDLVIGWLQHKVSAFAGGIM